MAMTLTVRLPADLDEQLRSRAESQGVKVSDFVRVAIAEKLERETASKVSPYELGKDVFGKYSFGDPDLSSNRKVRLKEILDAKRNRR
jgi:predicted DNA-binding protein